MIHVTLILITALVFSIVGTPLAKRVALRVGIISVPRSRDIHVAPVPLLGGAAIYLAFVVTFLSVNSRSYISEAIGILLGATLIALVGLVDDRWGIRASFKMLAQVGAGALLVTGGVQVQLFSEPWLNWLLTIVWVVGITNALNLLDNMDGLSGGVAFVAAAFFLLLATMNEPRQVMVAAMSAALMGACAGFLRYNLTSSIFMGDTGSMFIGFILAVLAIKLRFLSNVTIVTWMVPVFVLGLPIFDTSLVFVARIRRGVNPFTTAGKDHISHRLVALGLTKREAVLVCYLIAGCCGLVGVYVTQANLEEAYVVAGIMAVMLVVGVGWFEYMCPSGVCRTPARASE
jgi:UDP-GlcNAc:undecaprenyl-phosphate GlcNAc-1-phosphate transferase